MFISWKNILLESSFIPWKNYLLQSTFDPTKIYVWSVKNYGLLGKISLKNPQNSPEKFTFGPLKKYAFKIYV